MNKGFSLVELLVYLVCSALLLQALYMWLVPMMHHMHTQKAVYAQLMARWHAIEVSKALLAKGPHDCASYLYRQHDKIAWKDAHTHKTVGLSHHDNCLYALHGKRAQKLLSMVDSALFSYTVNAGQVQEIGISLTCKDASIAYVIKPTGKELHA